MWVQSRRLGGAREIVTADLRKATSRLTQTMPVCRGRPEVFPYPGTIWQIEHALWSPSNTNRKRVWEAAKEPLYGWCFWGSLLSSLAYFYSWKYFFLSLKKQTNQPSVFNWSGITSLPPPSPPSRPYQPLYLNPFHIPPHSQVDSLFLIIIIITYIHR